MIMMRAGLYVALMMVSVLLTACNGQQPSADSLVSYETAPLTIVTQAGEQHALTVEIANNEAQREHGLMFRETLPDDAGMIFIFDDEKPRAFWMKNTLIFLDMIFIDAQGIIVHIAPMARPHDLTPVPSQRPAKAVMEVRGGLAKELGIMTGDKIEFKGF